MSNKSLAIVIKEFHRETPRIIKKGAGQGFNIIFAFQINNRKTSKYFYDNSCNVARGICEKCKAPECTDRDWRKRGGFPP
jgi:hypothetical protein